MTYYDSTIGGWQAKSFDGVPLTLTLHILSFGIYCCGVIAWRRFFVLFGPVASLAGAKVDRLVFGNVIRYRWTELAVPCLPWFRFVSSWLNVCLVPSAF